MKIGSFKFLKDKKQKKFPQPFGKFCYDTEVSYQFWCEREIHLDNKDLFVVTSGPLRMKRPCLLGAKENWTWVVPEIFHFLTRLALSKSGYLLFGGQSEIGYQFWCYREIHLDNKYLFVVTSGPLRMKWPCLLEAKENWIWVVPEIFFFLTLFLRLLKFWGWSHSAYYLVPRENFSR